MEWLNNLSKAIEYIENHLDQEISFDEAAQIACCSTYYFQRIFSYVAGISLAEYIFPIREHHSSFSKRHSASIRERTLLFISSLLVLRPRIK